MATLAVTGSMADERHDLLTTADPDSSTWPLVLLVVRELLGMDH